MPRFHNPELDVMVSTSFKVMYSSLVHQADASALVEVPELVAARRHAGSTPHVLLVRNPVDRIVSAWRDKFRAQPAVYGTDDFVGWQRSQRLILGRLGLSDATGETKASALLELSFEGFVELLPRVYRLDGHYQPQVQRYWYRYRGLLPLRRAGITEFHRIESDSADELRERYGVDKGLVVHSTAAIERPDISRRTLERIADMYDSDARRFGYELV